MCCLQCLRGLAAIAWYTGPLGALSSALWYLHDSSPTPSAPTTHLTSYLAVYKGGELQQEPAT